MGRFLNQVVRAFSVTVVARRVSRAAPLSAPSLVSTSLFSHFIKKEPCTVALRLYRRLSELECNRNSTTYIPTWCRVGVVK